MEQHFSWAFFFILFFVQHNIAIKNIPNLAAQLDENAFQKSLNYSKFLQRTQCPIFLRLLGQNSKLRFTYGHYVSSANGSVYVVQSGRPPPRRTKILFLELLRTTAFARGRQWLQRRKRAHKNGLSADYTKKLTKLVKNFARFFAVFGHSLYLLPSCTCPKSQLTLQAF